MKQLRYLVVILGALMAFVASATVCFASPVLFNRPEVPPELLRD